MSEQTQDSCYGWHSGIKMLAEAGMPIKRAIERMKQFSDWGMVFKAAALHVRNLAMVVNDTWLLIWLPATTFEVAKKLRSVLGVRKPPIQVGAELHCMARRGLVTWDGERWVRKE